MPAMIPQKALPKVSCQCITYGRHHCLEEAIQFFLEQDYQGPKELVIVNDLPQQRLHFDHPEVKIINLKRRCPSIGVKRNLAVSECTGDVLFTWDDDDGFLPRHLSRCVELLADHAYVRPNKCFVWIEEATIERIAYSFVAQHVIAREAFDLVGGYPEMNSGEDASLDSKLGSAVDCHFPEIEPEDITYLFRWANGEYHLQGYGPDQPDRPTGFDRVGERVLKQLIRREIPAGDIELRPRHKHDYQKMVADYLRQHRAG